MSSLAFCIFYLKREVKKDGRFNIRNGYKSYGHTGVVSTVLSIDSFVIFLVNVIYILR